MLILPASSPTKKLKHLFIKISYVEGRLDKIGHAGLDKIGLRHHILFENENVNLQQLKICCKN